MPIKVRLVKTMVFPVVIYRCELDYKESWALKNWYFWTLVLEKTLESSLDCKEIQLVNPKGNQSWILIGRTDAKAETPILWPRDVKNWLIGKDPDAGKDWRQEEKGSTQDEMVGWHHWLNGHDFEQALGAGDGQGSLTHCSPWGCKESDMTERLNWDPPHWDWARYARSSCSYAFPFVQINLVTHQHDNDIITSLCSYIFYPLICFLKKIDVYRIMCCRELKHLVEIQRE